MSDATPKPVSTTAPHAALRTWRRGALVVAGWLFVAIGAVGVVLPVLPTTPFLLLAAACFSRSSPRFNDWLLHHRLFGSLIRDWRAHRAVTRRTRRWAIAVFLVTMSVSIITVPVAPVRVGLAVLAVGLLAMLLRLPTRGNEASPG